MAAMAGTGCDSSIRVETEEEKKEITRSAANYPPLILRMPAASFDGA